MHRDAFTSNKGTFTYTVLPFVIVSVEPTVFMQTVTCRNIGSLKHNTHFAYSQIKRAKELR